MGHRKHSQPRRGSLAYLPRSRAKTMEGKFRGWPEEESEEPKILGHCGFKAGCVQVVSIDDRDKTPNAGKQLVSLGTVIVTPPIVILGIRGYSKDLYGYHAEFDVYSQDIPKDISKHVSLKNKDSSIESAEKSLGKIKEIFAIVAVIPKKIGLSQKKPFVFEVAVKGGTVPKQFNYVKELLGKEVKIDQVFESGSRVDVAAITKGKGWQGVIQRYGAKRKQHKSRKTVRELGSLGPISPQYVMYTVPRAGQMGFHQRSEYDKRILIIDNTEKEKFKINPEGGYKHFGFVNGDYVILKGSVPGTYRRLIKLRKQIRNAPSKITKPNVLEVVI
ncbi:MAG: 50S ribosomal protein L3 [Nitrosopumilaceae archaeon]|nr:50S ribosomal protein L3 [Nitrosopumilaceae archaeon]NIU02535.1 50S ribosomal protein L3 [Nitrosopumilaceae archaeon]NIU88996.1 50S ribosomal protein L3 [Nitrosopumilaceae archaeon]NIV67107.1 50S ribosomal protein L3 [Nitrosopumilaceae archaeon]NIX63136.1 50S ribosomal protein L3 [Nitrosopumilaceae archaeon]